MRGAATIGLLVCGAAVLLAQLPFREYPAQEYNDFPLPDDYNVPGEFVFGRLMHADLDTRSGRRGGGRDWRQGYTWWTNDYPRAERHLLVALRRLTRVD